MKVKLRKSCFSYHRYLDQEFDLVKTDGIMANLVYVDRYGDNKSISLPQKELERIPVNYLVGQRVIINNSEIGTVTVPENESDFGVWVFSPIRGYACSFSQDNIDPLPNGQL